MPLLRKQELPDGSLLGVWKVQESLEWFSSHLDTVLPENITAQSRKIEFLAVRMLFRSLLGYEPVILHDALGAPYLESGILKISISHTKGYVAVMCHPVMNVGVDIEQYSSRPYLVRAKFLAQDEMPLGSFSESFACDYALICWSAKETVYKVCPSGAVDFLHNIKITPFSLLSTSGSIRIRETFSVPVREYCVNFNLNSEFVLTCTSCIF